MEALYVDPTIPRFTRHELVNEMAGRFAFTNGAFRKWQEKGLIAEPRRDHRWETGRAGSDEGLWSDIDRRMLVAVLELRDRFHSEIGEQFTLDKVCNFVVWSWVFFDDCVELNQARRALRTWAKPQIGGAHGGARSKAALTRRTRRWIDEIAAPGVMLNRRTRVAIRLSECLWSNDLAALRKLEGPLTEVLDPDGTGRRIGAPGASADAVDEIERLCLAHSAANALVTGRPALADGDWEVARRFMRQGWAAYSGEWQHLASQAITPEMFPEPDLNYQLGQCCQTLVPILGQVLQSRRGAPGGAPGTAGVGRFT